MNHSVAVAKHLFALSIFVSFLSPAIAGEPPDTEIVEVQVKSEFFKEHPAKKKKGKHSRFQISGLSCLDQTNCIAVADESVAIQTFTLEDLSGQPIVRPGTDYVDIVASLCGKVKSNCPETDLEAVAVAGDTVYVSGSFGVKRNSGLIHEDNWTLWRFRIDSLGVPRTGNGSSFEKVSNAVMARLLRSVKEIAPFIDVTLQCNGLNIEGLAYLAGKLYLGLRSPTIRRAGAAYILEVDADELFGGKIAPEDLFRKLFVVPFEENGQPITGTGIRALAEADDRLIIVTGDAGVKNLKKKDRTDKKYGLHCVDVFMESNLLNSPQKNDGRIWSWKPGDAKPNLLIKIDREKKRKLEAVTVVPRQNPSPNKVDLLIAFDGKKAENGAMKFLRNVTLP